jgi:hypothetical protein
MKKTKKDVKKEIVKSINTNALSIVVQKTDESISRALADVAQLLSNPLPPPVLGGVMRALRQAKSNIEKGLEPIAKQRLIAMVKEQGTAVTDKGTMEAIVEGWRFRMKPYRTGIDPKKLEKLIRAKGLNPDNYMSKVISYSFDETGANKLVDTKKMTADELESCHYEESWTVETPEADS